MFKIWRPDHPEDFTDHDMDLIKQMGYIPLFNTKIYIRFKPIIKR